MATRNFTIQAACSDTVSPVTAGTGKVTFRVPFALTALSVSASLTTAQTSGSLFTIDVKKNGTSIFSTLLTFDNTESTTLTAATPAVLSSTSLAADDEVRVDVTQVGDGTAVGLKIAISGNAAVLVDKAGDTMTGPLTVNVGGSVTNGIALLSGSSGAYTSYGLGRTIVEMNLGICSGATQWLTPVAGAGDAVLALFNSGRNLYIGTGSAANDLVFVTHDGERMRIDSSGNVGIGGTPGGGAKVEIIGSADPYTMIRSTGANPVQSYLQASSSASQGATGTINAYPFVVYTNSLERLRVGTSSEILRLSTTSARGTGSGYVTIYDPTGIKAYFGFGGSADDKFTFYNYLSYFQWYTNGSSLPQMVLDNSGNLGLGRVPTTALDVSAASAWVRLDSSSPSSSQSSIVQFDHSSTAKAYIGLAGATNALITGAALADLCFRSQGKNILWSTDSGASTLMKLGSGGGLSLNTGGLQMTGSTVGIEIGSPGTSNTPYIDFHSSAFSTDFDARFIASGGGSGGGSGRMELACGQFTINGYDMSPGMGFTYLGSLANTSIDSATGNGVWAITIAGVRSDALLAFNTTTSTGQVQMNFTYSGVLTWRNKTDSTTWTGWRQVVNQGDAIGSSSYIYADRMYCGYDAGTSGGISCNNWFRTSGDTGLYFASYGLGVLAQTNTYGSVRTYGSHNSYSGWAFGPSNAGTLVLMADDTSNYVGIYDTGTGWNMICPRGTRDAHFPANVIAYSTTASDRKLKKDIEPIRGALDKLLQITGVSYTMIDSGKKRVGVIAQDVQQVFPEAVESVEKINDDAEAMLTAPKEEILTVAYGNLMGPVIEALREINERLTKLEERVA